MNDAKRGTPVHYPFIIFGMVVNKIKDIKNFKKEDLVEWFGKAKGEDFYNFAFGIDERNVEPNREKQQVSRMITLRSDSRDFENIFDQIKLLFDKIK